MEHDERIIKAIFCAIDELNQDLMESQRIEKSLDLELTGKHSKLDSMAFLSFLLIVEAQIEKEYGIAIQVIDEDILAQQKVNPFATISSFMFYLSYLIDAHIIN
jgi:hypothetical protein